MFWIVCLFVYAVTGSQFKTVSQPTVHEYLFYGYFYRQTLPEANFYFGLNILENSQPSNDDVLKDYESNRELYSGSRYCWVDSAQHTLYILSESMYYESINAYAYSDSTLYLLTGDTLRQLQIGYNDIQEAKQEKTSQEISSMIVLNGTLYLSNDTHILNGSIARRNGRLLTFKHHLILLTYDTVYVYYESLKTQVAHQMPYWAYFTDSLLYVLDQTGISIYEGNHLNKRIELTMDCESLTVINHTILAVCQHAKRQFIAEYGEYLNRLYDIQSVKDITHHEELMFVLGRQYITIVTHSISRDAYDNLTYEIVDRFPCYDMESVLVAEKKSNSASVLLVGITSNQIKLIRFTKKPPRFVCDFSSIDDYLNVVVEAYSRYCFNYTEWISQESDTLCKAVFPFSFYFKEALEERSNNMISVTLLVFGIALTLIMLGSAVRWKYNMNRRLKMLRRMYKEKTAQTGGSSATHIVSV